MHHKNCHLFEQYITKIISRKYSVTKYPFMLHISQCFKKHPELRPSKVMRISEQSTKQAYVLKTSKLGPSSESQKNVNIYEKMPDQGINVGLVLNDKGKEKIAHGHDTTKKQQELS